MESLQSLQVTTYCSKTGPRHNSSEVQGNPGTGCETTFSALLSPQQVSCRTSEAEVPIKLTLWHWSYVDAIYPPASTGLQSPSTVPRYSVQPQRGCPASQTAPGRGKGLCLSPISLGD